LLRTKKKERGEGQLRRRKRIKQKYAKLKKNTHGIKISSTRKRKDNLPQETIERAKKGKAAAESKARWEASKKKKKQVFHRKPGKNCSTGGKQVPTMTEHKQNRRKGENGLKDKEVNTSLKNLHIGQARGQ